MYLDFLDVFSEKKALVLLEQTKFNKHDIELEKSKQLFYKPIYSLRLVKLKTLKFYIKIYLKTRFIQTSKFPSEALILFNKKLNGSFYLYIDY